jgi:hypothetical protein
MTWVGNEVCARWVCALSQKTGDGLQGSCIPGPAHKNLSGVVWGFEAALDVCNTRLVSFDLGFCNKCPHFVSSNHGAGTSKRPPVQSRCSSGWYSLHSSLRSRSLPPWGSSGIICPDRSNMLMIWQWHRVESHCTH